MTQYGIETIAANRRGRARTQDGRPLRRRSAAGRSRTLRLAAQLPSRGHTLGALRRELPRMVQLACARILLRAFVRQLLAGAAPLLGSHPYSARQQFRIITQKLPRAWSKNRKSNYTHGSFHCLCQCTSPPYSNSKNFKSASPCESHPDDCRFRF